MKPHSKTKIDQIYSKKPNTNHAKSKINIIQSGKQDEVRIDLKRPTLTMNSRNSLKGQFKSDSPSYDKGNMESNKMI